MGVIIRAFKVYGKSEFISRLKTIHTLSKNIFFVKQKLQRYLIQVISLVRLQRVGSDNC